MKRIICSILLVAMVISCVACGSSNTETSAELQNYIAEKGAFIEEQLELGANQGSGMEFDCSVYAEGNVLVIQFASDTYDILTAEQVKQASEMYTDMMKDVGPTMYKSLLQADAPFVNKVRELHVDSTGRIIYDNTYSVK